MRETKFRAWDKINKKMFYLGDIGDIVDREYISEEQRELFWSDNVILLQSTGLLDKNGVEIYEGDIVGDAEDWAIVIWCDKCIGWQLAWYDSGVNKKRCHMCDGNFDITETFEKGIADNGEKVIGNIYENPELLDK
jgi:uncharacterized phage protein (TIGR01671 family)